MRRYGREVFPIHLVPYHIFEIRLFYGLRHDILVKFYIGSFWIFWVRR